MAIQERKYYTAKLTPEYKANFQGSGDQNVQYNEDADFKQDLADYKSACKDIKENLNDVVTYLNKIKNHQNTGQNQEAYINKMISYVKSFKDALNSSTTKLANTINELNTALDKAIKEQQRREAKAKLNGNIQF